MRLFVATPMPPEATGVINAAAATLQHALNRPGWVRAQSYHLTWAFLGEHAESAIDRLAASLQRLSHAERALPVRIAGAGFFPSISRARVGWLALAPAEPLKELALAVRHAVSEAHVNFDEKPFVPHLTVVRMRQPWNRADLELFVREMGAVETEALIDHVSLFKSELHPEGAVHTELARVRLAEPPVAFDTV